ncbi:MAG: transposase [Methylobacter sp.]|nr:transposase [Methylobacter sp.]
MCSTPTAYATLNQALKRMGNNQQELLRVLDKPYLPLHNNLSERDIRDYVKKRKISGSTRSEAGRRCRDTFASLKKTCLKYGLSF